MDDHCWPQVGPRVLLGWMRHYFALAVYTLLNTMVRPLALRSHWFRLRRWADAWCWGSGHADTGTPAAEAVQPEGFVRALERAVDNGTVREVVMPNVPVASFTG